MNNVFKGIIFGTLLSIICSSYCYADDLVEVISIPAVAYTAEEIYEQSVMNGMAGRAGASTPYGAKGIVFENIVKDMENIKDTFNPERSTRLTYSSTATQSDLVTTNSKGIIVDRIQCKDTVSLSGARDTIAKVQNGQYRGTKIVGTKESAAAINAEAAKQGVNVKAKAAPVSDKITTKVANKYLGNTTVGQEVLHNVGCAAVAGAALEGGAALVQSVVNGDDFYTATGNVLTATGNGAIKGGVGAAAGTVACAGLAAAGVTAGAATVIVPVAVGTVAVVGTGIVLNKVEEKYDVQGKIAVATETAVDFTKDTAVAVADSVSEASHKAVEYGKKTSTTVVATVAEISK